MSDTTIEWCRRPRADGSLMPGYSYNGWWGCVEVSPACDDCYARTFAHRYGHEVWGKDAPRRFFGDAHWNDPVKWNAAAAKLGEQHLVFCGSMMDIFERRADLDDQRARLWKLIERTPHLIWLLLSKRKPLVPWTGRWPANVWLGITVETPEYLWRIEAALEHDAAVHFVSHEPALADTDFAPYLGPGRGKVNWLIVGSESGPRARPTPLDRVDRAVAQARAAGAAPFVKQLDGGLLGIGRRRGEVVKSLTALPEAYRVREWPVPPGQVRAGAAVDRTPAFPHRLA